MGGGGEVVGMDLATRPDGSTVREGEGAGSENWEGRIRGEIRKGKRETEERWRGRGLIQGGDDAFYVVIKNTQTLVKQHL